MSNATTSWNAVVEEDPETGDLLLPLDPALLSKLGWTEGTQLVWVDNNDGSWSLQKKDDASPA